MEYASRGKGNAALTTGIIGTVGAGLLLAGRGGLGGILGGPVNGMGPVAPVANEIHGIYNDTVEYKLATMYADLQECKSERYTDAVGLELYKAIVGGQKEAEDKRAAETKELFGYIIELNKEVALNKQANMYESVIARNEVNNLGRAVQGEICCLGKTLQTEINHNQELNGLADASIISYVNSNFVPGSLYIPSTSVYTSTTTS